MLETVFEVELTTSIGSFHIVPLEIFKACRLFSPQQVGTMRPTAASLDQTLSTTVPFITQTDIEDLKKELPHYLARIADLS